MKQISVLLLILTITTSTSFAGQIISPEEIADIKFFDCGSTEAGNNDTLEKFTMSAELENGERILVSSETGKAFATCKNIERGIKCRLGIFSSFVLDFSTLRHRTDLDTGKKYYSIKSIDHVYQCDQ